MNTETVLIGLAILSSSFWGSWHCAAMCGPIASVMANKNSLLQYQIGRGTSYVFMGIFGGYIGSFFLESNIELIRMIAGILFATVLIGIGIQTYRGRKSLSGLTLFKFHSYISKNTNGFFLGLLSVFLPCAWLYSYLLAAIATKSPLSGGLTLFLFWAGSLPAMNTMSLFMKKSIQLAPQRQQMVAGLLLVVAGLYSLISFYFFGHINH